MAEARHDPNQKWSRLTMNMALCYVGEVAVGIIDFQSSEELSISSTPAILVCFKTDRSQSPMDMAPSTIRIRCY